MTEHARYLEVGGEQVYAVTTPPAMTRRGAVVIVPPFASERIYAWPTLVRTARRLAADGFECVRFDQRGVGESTGELAGLGTAEWVEDVQAVAASVEPPVALLGVRFGALLAARAFADGLGAALVAWGPPATSRAALGEALRRKLAEEVAAGGPGGRTREEFTSALERGETVDVDGYRWGQRLWESAAELDAAPAPDGDRPRLSVKLTRGGEASTDGAAWTVPVPAPPFWWASPLLRPDLEGLLAPTSAWLTEALA